MKTEPRKQYTFYRSYYDAIQRLSKKDQSAIILAVCAYALYETEPSGLSGAASACFDLIKPTLDSGRRKAESGQKGGRKSNLYANAKQCESENDKEIEKETEYECTRPVEDESTIVEQIIALYHNLCPNLPPCHILSPTTRRAICNRWAEHPELKYFTRVFKAAQRSNLLNGNQVNWHASLDWLMDRNHFAKTYNGCYDNTAAQKQNVPTGGSGILGEAELQAIRAIMNESDNTLTTDADI